MKIVIGLNGQDIITGTKEACRSGEFGACTIFADDEARLSCLIIRCPA
jgi:aerobic-type carbon monoxide dehydrogenase small subunit (CoxS/CutS family)